MPTPIEKRNALMAARVIKNLEARHFEAVYCETAQQAIDTIKQMMPAGSSMSWGGSMTLRGMGLTKALHEAGCYEIVDRDLVTTQSDKRRCYLAAMDCDFYLTSCNAMSEDGVLVNIDRNGNRVAAITYGPRHVIHVVGVNKICATPEAALARARSTAAPTNAARFDGIKTPCAVTGVCANCKSPDSICCYVHMLRLCPDHRHTVVIVGESLGY